MEYSIETVSVTKTYGKHNALKNVSIHVPKGGIYGLIGRNGAGKTTLLRIICGLASATSGEYKIFGKLPAETDKKNSRPGLLIEEPGLYPKFTAKENMRIKCIAMGIKDKNVPDELLKLVGLADTGKKRVGNFSLGMKQRLGMALALIGNPEIVVLDEPINGLDPEGIIEVREMITKLNREKGITFVISSHILEELSKIATVYGIINKGELLEEIEAQELIKKCGERIELDTDDNEKACKVLKEFGITEFKLLDDGLINIFEQLDRRGDISFALAKENIKTDTICLKNESLENYYINLIGGNGGNDNV